MAVDTELMEALRQLINDESSAVIGDDELEQILDYCDESLSRAAAWCALIRANKVAEDQFEPPGWPTVPAPPTAPTLPDPPTWPTLDSEPASIQNYLDKSEDYTQLFSDYDGMGGHLSIANLQSNYRALAEERRRIWERERNDQIKEYEADYREWERKCEHLLRDWEQDIRIWAQQVSDMATAASQRNDRARIWQEQAREWGG